MPHGILAATDIPRPSHGNHRQSRVGRRDGGLVVATSTTLMGDYFHGEARSYNLKANC